MSCFVHRVALLLALVPFAPGASGEEVFLSIAGSIGAFRTDARIFNPSFTNDIVVQASFLPGGNVSNAGVVPKSITIGKRKMVSYDDVVTSLFGATGLGAIRLASDDTFIATQRIYAVTEHGTLGQFVPGRRMSEALHKSVIVHLKSSGEPGQKGTFRTNVGFVNPNNVVANIALTLYDRSDAVAGSAASLKVEPLGVVAPASLTSYFTVPANDLSDAWLSVRSDVPIFSYGSVIDNGTVDPTFVPAHEDAGVADTNPPGGSSSVFAGPDFQFSPADLTIEQGETVTWIFRSIHTSTSDSSSTENWNSGVKSEGDTFAFTFNNPGTFHYHCTLHSVSGGHQMNGTITVRAYDPYSDDSEPRD